MTGLIETIAVIGWTKLIFLALFLAFFVRYFKWVMIAVGIMGLFLIIFVFYPWIWIYLLVAL